MAITMTEPRPVEAIEQPQHPLTLPVFPRFTMQEAVILNLIANAYPDYLPEEEILRQLKKMADGHSLWWGPTRTSLQVSICLIRAKLGEKKRFPKRLISVYEIQANGKRGKLLGYAWKG